MHAEDAHPTAPAPASPPVHPVREVLVASRASDADRERTVALLGEQWIAGRLTLPELEARSAEAYRAAHVGQLWHAVRELPVVAPAAPPARCDLAVVSLVLGVMGACALLVSFGLLFVVSTPLSATAWITGRRARSRGAFEGGGNLARAGEVLGVVGTICGCLALAGCAAIVI